MTGLDTSSDHSCRGHTWLFRNQPERSQKMVFRRVQTGRRSPRGFGINIHSYLILGMNDWGDKPDVRVSDLILTEDKSGTGRCEDNLQAHISPTSPGSPILGRYFKLPDLPKSFDPDPPTLDSSLPYIPVYTHLKTFDLAPIERPNTPPIINKLRSSGSMQPKNRSKSRSTAVANGRTDDAVDRADQTVDYSRRITKYEDSVITSPSEST